MYIGAIPTPAATESRQEFTATANQTVFNTTGGTVGYCDCYLNGVKMAASDFSFDGADVTLTTGAAAGDVLAVVMRQADNALVALPIKDSAGNNVLSETNSVVTLSNDIAMPTIAGVSSGTYGNQTQAAGGKCLQIQQATHEDQLALGSSNTGYNIISVLITPQQANSKILIMLDLWVGSFNPNGGLRLKRTVNGVSSYLGETSTYYSDQGFYNSDDYIQFNSYTFSNFNWSYLDSHGSNGTSTIDYRIEPNGVSDLYINRSSQGTSNARARSTITAMEFA